MVWRILVNRDTFEEQQHLFIEEREDHSKE